MSYNISAWHTRKLDNFRVNLDALCAQEWAAVRVLPGDLLSVTLNDSEECEIFGRDMIGDALIVEEINLSGEGSGRFWETFEKFLRENSAGYANFLIVWEDGDEVWELIVNEGVITENDLTELPQE